MRHVAAIPCVALLAGAASGLAFSDIPRTFLIAVLLGAAAVAAWAWMHGGARTTAAAIACVFWAGGGLLAADAWQRAWRPPLRTVFEALAREQRAQAQRDGRRLPQDDEAFATIAGTLRGDAA